VQMFDREGTFVWRMGGHGSGPGQLDRPAGLAIHPDGRLVVSDCLNHRIQFFNYDGEHVGTIGGHGSGPGQLNMPWGITVDRAGDIYVSDWGNDRVQKLSPGGQHLATYGTSGTGEGQLRRPSGVGVDSRGAVYVSDYGNDRVQVFESDGRPLTTLLGDATPSKWGLQSIDIDPESTELRALHHDDVTAQERVFEGPMGIEIDEHDRVLIADCCKHRVQVYQRV
jgi:DNA-binding beta-propeller fold protein YncE